MIEDSEEEEADEEDGCWIRAAADVTAELGSAL